MKKRIISIGIAVVMLFALVALAGCNNGTERHPNSDPAIETQLEQQIRKDLLLVAWENSTENYSDSIMQHISIVKYLGTYNGSVAMLVNLYEGFPLQSLPFVTSHDDGVVIAGIMSLDLVWRDGDFYRFTSALEQGILSQEDLEKINYLRNK